MEFEIREAELKHADTIVSLTNELGYISTVEKIKDKLNRFAQSPDQVIFVAVRDDTIGWIHVTLAEPLESEIFAELRGIVVKEEYRGQGVGKKLIQAAEQWTRNKGISRIRIRTNIKRRAVRKYYRSLGFHSIKTQEVFERDFS